MPVARNVRQPILTFMPSSPARRRIMRQASTRCMASPAELAGAAASGAEEGPLLLFTDAHGVDVRVEVALKRVVGRHLVALAAFLVEAEPPALPFWVVAFDLEADRGTDPDTPDHISACVASVDSQAR